MSSALSASDRVVWLLRNWYDARESWTDKTQADGIGSVLPSDWVGSSYPELERRLIDMREGGSHHHVLWWHTTNRYRDGHRLTLRVPYRQTKAGVRYILPDPHVIEVIAGPHIEGPLARIAIYRFSLNVRQDLADQGVHHLTTTMHEGRTEQIRLPEDLYRHATGQEALTPEAKALRKRPRGVAA